MRGGDFMTGLGRVYLVYTIGFFGVTVLLGLAEFLGLSHQWIGYGFMALTVGIYAAIGVMARTTEVSEYYIVGRRVPAFYNGMATAADWMSAASFLGMAGMLYAEGYQGLAFVVGWTGGYVLVGTLLAPYLRKFGQYTVPDFLGARYGGDGARAIGVVILIAVSFTYVVAQMYGVGLIASRFLGLPFETAVFVGLVGILVCSMLGGMRAVTWTQVAQYLVVIVAFFVPVVWVSVKVTGIPLPQFTYGEAIRRVNDIQAALGLAPDFGQAFTGPTDAVNFFALVLCLTIGTASLPHLLTRYFATPSVREARVSVAWSLLFISLFYITVPAYAAFAKLEILQSVIGQPMGNIPEWFGAWSQTGLAALCDPAAATVSDLCNAASAHGVLHFGQFVIDRDVVVLAMPEIAGLPFAVSGLVAAGALAAALSSSDGLLLAIANALSHDIYYRMVAPQAAPKRRMVISRLLLLAVALAAAWTASQKPSNILTMVAWAFSLAASGLFPALVLGIWWKRTTNPGAVAGMVVGFTVALYYLLATQFMAEPLWFGIRNIACGAFGIPAGFLTAILVSLVTKAPSAEMQGFIDSIRVPKGAVKLARPR